MPTPRKRRQGWFIESEAAPESAPNLYAFVHAGGRADRFPDWQPELEDKARIVGMCPPGTGHRFAEPRLGSVAELAESAAAAIAEADRGPCFLFGHSLGAVAAFETARRLPEPPVALVVSGCAGPPLLPSKRVVRLASLPTEAFAEEVRFFGGIPPELESGSEAATLLLERLRLDFEMVASYEFRPTVALDVSVVCVVGDEDPHVDREGAGRWQDVTVRPLEQHELPGGHFYFEDDSRALTDLLRETTGREHPKPETHIELI